MWNSNRFLKRKYMSWQTIVFNVIFWTAFYFCLRYDIFHYITERTFYYGVLLVYSISIIIKLIPERRNKKLVFAIKAKDRCYVIGTLIHVLIPMYLIGYIGKRHEEDTWLIFQH